MMILQFLQHVFSIVTGIFAWAVIVFFMYIFGLSLTPAKYFEQLKQTSHAIVLGAAVTVLWCWYGIELGIPFPWVMKALIIFVLCLLVLRRKVLNFSGLFEPVFLRQIVNLLMAFSLFYVLTYLFLMPSVSDKFLPLVRTGNNDILNYINYATYLQQLGPSNVVGHSFQDTTELIYGFIPSAFYILVAVSSFFGDEVMRATMPALFGIAALMGYGVVQLARSAFGLSMPIALGIAAVVVSGPFQRYILANYFLSQTVGSLLIIVMLTQTVEILMRRSSSNSFILMLWFLPYYVLLFYSYPPLFIIGLGLQLGFVSFFYMLSMLAWPILKPGVVEIFRAMLRWTVAVVGSIVIIGLLDLGHFYKVWGNLFYISKAGVNGWALSFISPFSVLGFPGPLQIQRITTAWSIGVVSTIVMVSFGFLMLRRYRQRVPEAGIALLFLAITAFIGYFIYALLVGPAYQQWKLASYLLLPTAFVFFAVLSRVLQCKNKMTVLVCFILVFGNMIIHGFRAPPLEKFSSSYANLKALEMIDTSKDIYIQMASYSTTFLPVYFVRNKRLHLISPSYYAQQALKLQEVSPQKPLFIEGEMCETGAFRVSISGVGCLFLSPPSLKMGSHYFFSQQIPGLLSPSGLSGAESWGRWSDASSAELTFMFDADDLVKQGSGFINFEICPFLFNEVKSQIILISWGKGRRARGTIEALGWISIPYTKADWGGFEAREMSIKFTFPGATAPHDLDPKSNDTRKLAIGFESISVTKQPLGKLLGET